MSRRAMLSLSEAAVARRSATAAPTDRPRERRNTAEGPQRGAAPGLLHSVTVREATVGDGPSPTPTLLFEGYASVTERSYDMFDAFGPYTETIARGAFAETLGSGADVAFLLNHSGMTLARTTSGTLRLREDDEGLHTSADLDPRVSVVRDMAVQLERRDLDQMSFAFRIVRGEWDPSYTAYRITQVDMHRGDVSVVNYGANPNTTGGLVAADPSDLDVEALDDDAARALMQRLEQRARRDGASRPTALDLEALRRLASPHPLAQRSLEG